MRLRRIEAVSYGGLTGVSLGDLGDGLTVVHGPNESGKSTLVSLVRHVLYGYPTAREREAGYLVPGGKRVGRLVFADGDTSWVLERVEGPRGGHLTARSLDGTQRPGLPEDLVADVSAQTYRVVFGFGLEDMPGIEDGRGAPDDDIMGRLYSASAGLTVSPQQVRAAIDAEAEALFKPSARQRELNELVRGLRDVRGRIRDHMKAAEALADDRERADEIGRRLAEARQVRDAARTRATALVVATERADERIGTINQQEESLLELRREQKRLEDERVAAAIDEALKTAAPELDALLLESAGASASADVLADAEQALVRARTRERDAIARTGLPDDVVAALGDAGDLAAQVEQTREEIDALARRFESRQETAEQAASALERARSAAVRLLEPLGIDPGQAAESIGRRLDALDTLERLRGGAAAPAIRGGDMPSLVLAVSGLAAIVGGVWFEQWVAAGIGAVLLVVGVVFLFRARMGAPALPRADERPYLEMIGLDSSAGTLEILGARRALEGARRAVEALEAAGTSAESAAQDASLAGNALETRRALWSSWLAERALPADLTPAAAAVLLGRLAEARSAGTAVAEAAADVERITARMDDFAVRLADAARPFVPVPSGPTRADVPVMASRVAERLEALRAQIARAEEIARDAAAIAERIEDEEMRRARAAHDLHGILERFDLADGGTHDDLHVLRREAEREAAEADAAVEELTDERSGLEERLATAERERVGEELRLEEAGLLERIGETVDRYLALTLASRLLGRAQERYQRERQPDVVKHAGRVFREITDGRYTDLSMPLTGGRIEVFDTHASALTSDILSAGTADQLYLALRIGLVAQLGEVGASLPVLMDDVLVNFDPPRKRGAVRAIAELASTRQVVFFTCHPDTAALFAEAAPGHVRLEMERVSR